MQSERASQSVRQLTAVRDCVIKRERERERERERNEGSRIRKTEREREKERDWGNGREVGVRQ